jgi:hypothetical protein
VNAPNVVVAAARIFARQQAVAIDAPERREKPRRA